MWSVLVLNRWVHNHQGNAQLSLLPHRAIQRASFVPPPLLVVPRLKTTNDGCGMTSPAEVKIIVGGRRTCRGWGGNAGSINTDACFNTCVSQGSSRMATSQLVLGRVIRRADTGGHTQQPLIIVGDVMIIEHFVK